MAGQVVLLLHGAAEDLLHATGHHRNPRHYQARNIVLHLNVSHCPAPPQQPKSSSINVPEPSNSMLESSSPVSNLHLRF